MLYYGENVSAGYTHGCLGALLEIGGRQLEILSSARQGDVRRVAGLKFKLTHTGKN